jgi:hypothetical protein
MKDYRKDLIGKRRHAKLKKSEILNGTVIGIASLWLIWVSTSVLLHFVG